MQGYRLVSSGSGYKPVTDTCEHGNEPLHCINSGRFTDAVWLLALNDGLHGVSYQCSHFPLSFLHPYIYLAQVMIGFAWQPLDKWD